MRHRPVITSIILSLCAHNAYASDTASVAQALGWIKGPSCHNYCPGQFQQPTDINHHTSPALISQSTTTITANGPVSFSANHTSELRGGITVTQPGRKLLADFAALRLDQQQQVQILELRGNVRLYEPGKALIADQALIQLQQDWAKLENAAYRLEQLTSLEQLTAWGKALLIDHHKQITRLTKATYTTCAPTNCVWQIRSRLLELDHQKGVGVAHHASIHLWRLPILYTPYFSFPLDDRRKSGFLLPSVAYTDDNGAELEIPYYFNLAPNYDTVLSANIMTKRGAQFTSNSRFLTPHSHGDLLAQIIFNDREFSHFQDDKVALYAGDPLRAPFLSRLESASNTRWLLSYQQQNSWHPNWSANIDMNIVSDDYYLHDFGNNPLATNQDQLQNQAMVTFNSEHWQARVRGLLYQTLHPIDSISPEPYYRLPEIYLHSHYPLVFDCLDAELTLDLNRFEHRRFFASDLAVITGDRWHARPSLGLPLYQAYGYFFPKLQLDLTKYSLTGVADGLETQPDRTLPLISIDSGLRFERDSRFGQQHWLQTLEPRAFYLYTPKRNQDDIPLFDTSLPPFNFEQMFFDNRFAGGDRISDANQLAMALTTRVLDYGNQHELMSASVATLYYFEQPEICLTPNCSTDPAPHSKVSPIITNLNLHFSQYWDASGTWTWNPRDNVTDNAHITVHLQGSAQTILDLGYDFVRDGDKILDSRSGDLSRVHIGLSLPWKQWQLMASWRYNLSHSHPQSYFGGLAYESCCWGLRVIASRTILDTNLNDNTKFDTKFYVQVKLKGLGTVGNSNPTNLLKTGINGFADQFRG